MHLDIYSSFIHNLKYLEATMMLFSTWKDRLLHADNEILFDAKEKWAIKP